MNVVLALLAMMPLYSTVAVGDSSGHHAHGHATTPSGRVGEREFGRTGDPEKVTRAISIDMSDKMRFNPSNLRVKQGETVRFVVSNSGKTMHEMVLGTMQGLKEHAALMRKHAGMEHDESHMVHVEPGGSQEIVWQFTRAGTFHYGCLIPGHFEAGMVGKIVVAR